MMNAMPLNGVMSLPPAASTSSSKPPIYLRLTEETLALFASQHPPKGLCIVEGDSPILRIDDDHHALDCVDDDNPFEIVSHRNGVLTSVGVTSSRYTMRADIADLRAKARSRTEAEQRQKDAHRSINLDDTRTSRSPVPKPAPKSRAASPATSTTVPKPRVPSRLVASHVPTRQLPDEAATPPSAGSDRSTFYVEVPVSGSSTDGSTTSSKSDRTSTTRRTSISSGDSPPEEATKPVTVVVPTASKAAPTISKAAAPSATKKGKARASTPSISVVPPQPVVSVVTTSRVVAQPPSRKRSHDSVSSSEAAGGRVDSDGGGSGSEPRSKAPRVQARGASGARLSKPMQRSPSDSPSNSTRVLPAKVDKLTAPSDDPGAARAAVLASVGIKKRKLSTAENTPSGSRAGTPLLMTPATGNKSSTKNRKAEWDYTSSEDEEPLVKAAKRPAVGLGIAAARSEVKSLTSKRVAELASGAERATTMTSSASSRAPSVRSSSPAAPVPMSKFEVHSNADFIRLAERFEREQKEFEDRRQLLEKQRTALSEAIKRGMDRTPREGTLERVTRGELQAETRRARARYDELVEIKAALQKWTAANDRFKPVST